MLLQNAERAGYNLVLQWNDQNINRKQQHAIAVENNQQK